MALQDAGVLEITSSAEAYTRYLELQGDNPAYSAGNIALAMVQDANVAVFGTKEKWKMLGRSVPASENGNSIHIFRPFHLWQGAIRWQTPTMYGRRRGGL